jgi:uncharacterized lipoprotein YddW (UPF0748 family)
MQIERIKTILRRLSVMMIAIIISFGQMSFTEDQMSAATTSFKGLWVATVYHIDFPSTPTTEPSLLKADINAILDTAEAAGMNAVIVQVRPTGDALYASSIYPWSKFLTGEEDLAPQNGFDPLEYWVEEAHKRGIECHAWLNPYRITRDLKADITDPFATLSSKNPAVKSPNLTVRYTDGNLYYNPGLPEVESLIIAGVEELINAYDIDGIHFDDYFYPGQDFEDSSAYNRYKYFGESRDDFRRRSVTHMIAEVYKTVHNLSNDVVFGVSPFGIWANDTSSPDGSKTRGNQSYSSHYADTKTWVERGIVDYIAPQLYWHIGYNIADYKVLANWWADLVEGTDVDLYIGHGAYRVQTSDISAPWYGTSEIEKQIILNQTLPAIKGSIYYNYSALRRSPDLIKTIAMQVCDSGDKEENAIFEETFSDFLPQGDLKFQANTPITLSCRAPLGTIVNVKIAGRYYFLKPVTETGEIVEYSVRIERPITLNQSSITPHYTLRYKGVTHEFDAVGKLLIE